ncbi:MAG: hypothetical protein AAGL98_12500 [Planctomycetota bacterium]
MSPLPTDNFQQARKVRVTAPAVRFSRLACVALALSLIAWAVPLLSAAVVVLSIGALRAVRRAPRANLKLRGGGLAAVALVLSLGGVAGQGYVGARGFTVYQQLRSGPASAITAGLGGDTAGFLTAFPEAAVSPDAAEFFLDELEARYGPLIHAKPKTAPRVLPALCAEPVDQSYRLQFARGIVTARAAFRPTPAEARSWPAAPGIASLTIHDPERGALVFPETRLSEVQP